MTRGTTGNTHRPAHGAVADPRHRVAVTLILTQTRAGAVSSVGSWQKIDRLESRDKRETREPHLGDRDHHTRRPSSPRRRYTPPTLDHRLRLRIFCDQVCHLNILVRIFSMRLGLPLPGYCEVMAVTRVTTHIYISLSRRIRIKILFPKLL